MQVDYVVLLLGIFDVVVGVLGLFGIAPRVPEKYSGKSWTKAYSRSIAISEIVLGVPWIATTLFLGTRPEMSTTIRLVLWFVSLVPGLVCAIAADQKYKKMLKDSIE